MYCKRETKEKYRHRKQKKKNKKHRVKGKMNKIKYQTIRTEKRKNTEHCGNRKNLETGN